MENKYIVANWKMNGSLAIARELSATVAQTSSELSEQVQMVLCPPAPYISEVAQAVKGCRVALGGQNCHAELSGAFTGETSAAMLADLGVRYVILGHSERRLHSGETDGDVKNKANTAISQCLIPIICVGESLEDRQAGKAVETVLQQMKDSLPNPQLPVASHFILAYEPIWAIGSGQIPSMDDIASMHCALVESLQQHTGQQMPVIYGGSVHAENAQAILHTDHVSGVLVGGASLKAESFSAIARAAN